MKSSVVLTEDAAHVSLSSALLLQRHEPLTPLIFPDLNKRRDKKSLLRFGSEMKLEDPLQFFLFIKYFLNDQHRFSGGFKNLVLKM